MILLAEKLIAIPVEEMTRLWEFFRTAKLISKNDEKDLKKYY